MQTLEVNAPNGRYAIWAKRGLLQDMEAFLPLLKGGAAAIITDDTVRGLYGERLRAALEAAGVRCMLFSFPAGEESKNHTTLCAAYGALMEQGMTRKDTIIALGGGVVGDLAGFTAATLLRGVPFIQVPTTLLAQVDSSVGGKVAVDIPAGKNLVGAFYQPRRVLIDPDTLTTLPQRQLACGIGEMIKHGAIASRTLWDEMAGMPKAALLQRADELVIENCRIKAGYVEADPLDKGLRMTLNFGHTLGHALEKQMGYGTLTHGEAVAMGMEAMTRWGEAWGVTEPGTHAAMVSVLQKWGLPDHALEDAAEILLREASYDKKAAGSRITLVALKRLGEAVLLPLEREALRQRMEALMA